MKPLVSVLIPTYNVSSYIIQAIESVINQTMADFEIIIIDDFSTDETVKKIQAIEDNRIKLYRNEKNMGPSYSRNRALNKSIGKWVAILDSDDYWELDRLEKLIEVTKKYNVEVVCDDLYLVEDGNDVPFNSYLKSRESVIGVIKDPTIISAVKMINDDYGFLKPLISADFIRKKKIEYKIGLSYGEDFRFLVELLIAGAQMIIIPQPMYYYRWNRADALTSKIFDGTKQQIISTNELINLYSDQSGVKRAFIQHIKKKKLGLVRLEIDYWIDRGNFTRVICKIIKNPRVLKFLIRERIKFNRREIKME